MAGQVRKPNNREFDIRDDETYSDWKRRKAEEEGKEVEEQILDESEIH